MASTLQGLDTLSHMDRHLFETFSRGTHIEPPFSLVHEAFEDVVNRQSHDVAVEYDGDTLTYRQLDRAANILANKLIRDGLQPRQIVCILVQRSIYMVVAMLAVLKCGCQYAPLDGGVLPETLLRYILVNTQANNGASVVVLDSAEEDNSKDISDRPGVDVSPLDGAYVIYTSGTTGIPKGVDVSHRNVTNLLCLSPGSLGINRGTNVPQLLSISFDMGQWEILGTLLNGGTLLLRTSDWPAVLRRAHTIISTPSILSTIKRADYPNIQTVALAGESCPATLANEWSEHVMLYNCCGPTEITIVNTIKLHKPGEKLSIGAPVPNTNVYILDDDENPLPIGSVGIMWAAGRCVSRGYVDLPELTAEKFKYDRFENNGSFMFNTGDLGRWMEDGTLEHRGRIDHQVKIMGFRVELDGVSAAIEKAAGVTRGCAILHGEVLWGFYSGSSDINEIAVKIVVEKYQPYYAVPQKWVCSVTLPLTPNGKIDRKALLASLSSPLIDDYTSRSETVAILALPEKVLLRSASDTSSPVSEAEMCKSSLSLVRYTLPEKKGLHGWRALRHRTFSLYRRLFSVVFVTNLVLLIVMLTKRGGPKLEHLAIATAANLAASVLFRQDYVINFLFTVACSVPTSAPIFIRRNCAKIYHIGGLHSGLAVASTFWLLAFTITTTIRGSYPATLVVSYALVGLLCTILALAHPTYRAQFHNRFEMVHRFAGWLGLALFWVQTVLFTWESMGTSRLGHALLCSPGIWLLAIATGSIIISWARLRKVTVRPDVLSAHAARLYFTYTNATVGTAVRISERPLLEWHAFATIAKPNEQGFSLLVSNAGDWTSRQIKRAPTKIWVRGIPTCGVLRIAPLFKSIVLVATGSGIGPCLPVIYAKKLPARIFWSTPHPEQNFGSEIIAAVLDADPGAVIHDTKTKGRPDMVAVSYRLLRESGAEAVCVISNKKLTQMIVYAMESRGIPAFGAIWDS
ncbi:Adenylate-forming reductase [Lachnellula occidentalis]|uniref:Adenylate-forming reductase n=1 Tax=Lachnellula occidentalis TaxID=215460 RepID=A0A8H8U9B5_9HELO|nr:Adenylate-forming reductase [Lachnellula occidentalis]